MKIIITMKDEDLDKTVDEVLSIGEAVYNKYHLKVCRCKCMKDGTSLILSK